MLPNPQGEKAKRLAAAAKRARENAPKVKAVIADFYGLRVEGRLHEYEDPGKSVGGYVEYTVLSPTGQVMQRFQMSWDMHGNVGGAGPPELVRAIKKAWPDKWPVEGPQGEPV
jgi:hypothetical protein